MLTSALYTSLSGLTAAAKAVAVTSNNIANAQTPNYTNQAVSFQTVTPYGVRAIGPISNRNEALAQTISKVTSGQQYSQTLSDISKSLDSSVNTFDGSVYANLQDLTDAFSQLATSSSNPTAVKQYVLDKANQLVNTFHDNANTISDKSDELRANNTQLLNSANTLISDIADLNGKIASAIDPSSKSSLIDTRQTKLEELSKLTDVTTTSQVNDQITVMVGDKLVVSNTDKTPLLDYTKITGGIIGANNTAITTVIPKQLAELDNMAADVAEQVNGILKQPLFSLPGKYTIGFANEITTLMTDANNLTSSFDSKGMTSALKDIQYQASNNYTQFGAFQSSLATSSDSSSVQLLGLNSYRQDTEGVSLENEAINLQRFRTAYEANAKVITVVDDMFKTTLNMLG